VRKQTKENDKLRPQRPNIQELENQDEQPEIKKNPKFEKLGKPS